MKLYLIAPGNSQHTLKWCNALCAKGFEVGLFTVHSTSGLNYHNSIKVYDFTKYGKIIGSVLITVKLLLLSMYTNYLLHAHYASSYGTIARAVFTKRYMLSVWGSDVYEFPLQSNWKRWLLIKNLKGADLICSTSENMKEQVERLIGNKKVVVIPFGVDHKLFKKCSSLRSKERQTPKGEIVICTIKSYGEIYGTDILLKVFQKILFEYCKNNTNEKKLILEIYGSGNQKPYKKLISELNIGDNVRLFPGVSNSEVPNILNGVDLFIALSRAESFGVSLLEAIFCEVPFVVSSAPGFFEIAATLNSGVIVDLNDYNEISKIILKNIYCTPSVDTLSRSRMICVEKYSSEICVNKMIEEYKKMRL